LDLFFANALPLLDSVFVTSPWLALPAEARAQPKLRPLVQESWDRALSRHLDPEQLLVELDVPEDELVEYRLAHPLASVLPVIRRLLVRDADDDSGMLVAVGDAMGRLLWVDGDRALRRRAESMLFVEGAGWSEAQVGTSAPGTALELDHGIQISGDEHFNKLVHGWSCTAVPIHDPETRAIIGVIDITGGQQAVDPHTLPLMEATAAAVESELMVQRLTAQRFQVGAAAGRGRRSPSSVINLGSITYFGAESAAPRAESASASAIRLPKPAASQRVTLRILGRDTGELVVGESRIELSARHTEIVTLLAWHRQGLSADRLADMVYGDDLSAGTLRAEMVRLRRILDSVAPGLSPESRPYRLRQTVELDAQQVGSLLDRGAHRVALATASGPVLPASLAPGIEAIRFEVRGHLRESLLTDASVDVLLEYAQTDDAADDIEVWTAVLRLLPARSPRRAGVVHHIEQLERS
jgi:hypothetical protein